MGLWAGGRLEPRSHAAMGGNYSFPGFGVIGSTPVLRVNQHGKRYSDVTKIPAVIDQHHCLHCGRCKEVCPKQAIYIKG